MENKKLALNFLNAFFGRDIEAMKGALDEAATWWLPPSFGPDHFMSGRDAIFAKFIARADGKLASGSLQHEVLTVTADGERVVIECLVRMKLRDGTPTENNYVYVITFKDGKIVSVRDHFDTLRASKYFL